MSKRDELVAVLRANPWSQTDYSLEHVADKILALEEPVWEYGYTGDRTDDPERAPYVHDIGRPRADILKYWQEAMGYTANGLVRRRKAGPWEKI